MNSFKIYFSDKNNIPGFFKLFSHHFWDIDSTDFPQDIVLTTLWGGGSNLVNPPQPKDRKLILGRGNQYMKHETEKHQTKSRIYIICIVQTVVCLSLLSYS